MLAKTIDSGTLNFRERPQLSFWVQNNDLSLVKSETPLVVNPKIINIVLDFDGVFTFPHGLLKEILKKYDYKLDDISPYQPDRQDTLEVMHRQKPSKSIEDIWADYQAMIKEYYVSRLVEVPLAPGAKEVLEKWQALPYVSVYNVTSRESSESCQELQALGLYFQRNKISLDGIINTSNTSKKPALFFLSPAIFADDSYNKLQDIFEDIGCTKLDRQIQEVEIALFRHESNRQIRPTGLIQDLKNGWWDLDLMVQEIARKRKLK